MIAAEDALNRILALAPPRRSINVPIMEAASRYLARDVIALRDQPARDLSAMDGYAVSGPAPWTMLGESAAGHAWRGQLAAGQCVRIFTGAIVPSGADAVVMQEDVKREGDLVCLSDNAPGPFPGRHIRAQASDFAAGQPLIKAGALLTPPRLALAATAGHGEVDVPAPIRVSILSTGSELVPLGQPCSDEQIPASNGVMIASLVQRAGVIIDDLGIVIDDPDALAKALARAAGSDILVTIGGASVGDHDLVRPALEAAGASIDFWKVAIKPGKPLMAGKLGEACVIGLPGNPVSAYVTAMLFLHPLIERMRGNPATGLERANAQLGEPLPANGNRTDHIRARLDNGIAWPVGINDSAALSALAAADCLIVRPPGADAVAAGAEVPILLMA